MAAEMMGATESIFIKANIAALVGTGFVGIFLDHRAKLRATLQFRLRVLGALLRLLRLYFVLEIRISARRTMPGDLNSSLCSL